ncbi:MULTISPECIES: endonuclease NucS domain-containing protein [Okeania]|uniref:DUF91 domain-containing protein n=1 Tax=Okeania hirsuta TaxID=1458930 RepID=A0A3N6NDS6_9CYAN|nr:MULTISPECIES: endonuclease NucS domain-containing protein [Okeania]NET16940.1 DUF91 domain-containing protein [Okeania sp. SIO1H6]NES75997.1 DUF91 domain-containing protein [Okeania sp. SIO1H4]NES89799.1 DUF91 domain-containing protein [Okeania sp. SIO2B9]NET19551.1 DUF91 domain-containing protein [Okeania sp. SIO1H5]NET75747.1 DUF91 domain-containing protein [Okeania sp. SIO1F9]
MPYLKAKHLTEAEKKRDEKVAKSTRNLVLINDKIKFQSEEDLENYIEENFNQILPGLVLIKRQHTINTQRCDLLCSIKSVKQPVIIELKNEEDRNLISQLTRYRKALLIEKPFPEQIDYSLPVKLIAIAPTFHEDNYTDQEASKFENDFCLWEFSIDIEQGKDIAQFNLSGKTYDIPYPIFGFPGKILNSESYSKSLPTFAWEFYFRLDQKYKKDFQGLRNQLIVQPKIKEMVSTSYRKVLYGTGEGKNHKKLAEITNTPGKDLCLFLWLPTSVDTKSEKPVARCGFVLKNSSNSLSNDSVVEWLVSTKETLNNKNTPDINSEVAAYGRDGTLKWSRANLYLGNVTFRYTQDPVKLDEWKRVAKTSSSKVLNQIVNSYQNNPTFWLLMYVLKGVTPKTITDEDRIWWESYKTKTPIHLGWYIDLALKTWNYKIK